MLTENEDKYRTYRMVLELKVRNGFNFQVEDFLAFVRHRLNLQGFMLLGKLMWCGEATDTPKELRNENAKEVLS